MKAAMSKKVEKIISEGNGYELLKAVMVGSRSLKKEFDVPFNNKIIHVKKLGIF